MFKVMFRITVCLALATILAVHAVLEILKSYGVFLLILMAGLLVIVPSLMIVMYLSTLLQG